MVHSCKRKPAEREEEREDGLRARGSGLVLFSVNDVQTRQAAQLLEAWQDGSTIVPHQDECTEFRALQEGLQGREAMAEAEVEVFELRAALEGLEEHKAVVASVEVFQVGEGGAPIQGFQPDASHGQEMEADQGGEGGAEAQLPIGLPDLFLPLLVIRVI